VLVTERLDAAYLVELRASVFCLNPVGFGWAIRLSTAAVHGCIPVTLQVGWLAGMGWHGRALHCAQARQ
jgi:hypothetical protein